ncbi:MAG: sugar phosphate nucleotidyltransferase, partial [Nitrospirota bacterium]
MKAMILAAGLGTRLRPITNNTPKPIIPVGDRPLIEYLLLLLKKYGIKDIIINLHHLGEKIE